ncbi:MULTISPECIES: sensor histidine kinase [Streptomyces]|uniref:histidine kinase n=1 Tax=Streptomyces solicathayae TaxID=3081768 RepID=A0ABZ0LWD2_9ACTN|nr:HAMP domain-containing sensor histidine kinase [Streptomyces sp. HUAS YS2]WOX23801.1 HAMP domain-containing sensor histidine kinase [Streptomyces sp. HUAS YS2]
MAERRRRYGPVWASGLAAAFVVVVAVCWLAYADGRAGPRSPVIAVLIRDDRVGPQVELIAGGGAVAGALCVAAACWWAGRAHPRAVRLRTAVVAGAVSGILFTTYCAWLRTENEVKPWLVAEEALRWGLACIAPSAGLLTAAAVWAALGRGGGLSFRSRLALAAAGATGALSLGGLVLLRRAQLAQDANLIFWIAMTTGVPLITLLTGVLVHVSVARALRPVEAIRRELADITGQSLDRRVPVPPTEDAIARLARTTNDTLDRLEQASARQQQFVADAAHELRSPLAALRAQLESALRHPDSVAWPAVVADAAADVVRLQALADDLLLLASLDGTRHRSRAAEPVDLAALAEDLVREYQHLPESARLRIACAAVTPAVVDGSATQLERLLRNLLGNACRHAAAVVDVTVRVADGAVVLEVHDDGPGIPPEDRARVFGRFTRLDESRTRTAGGAGLGLPIARDIATRHGGTLVIAATERGARLLASFPTAGEPGVPGAGPSASAQPTPVART